MVCCCVCEDKYIMFTMVLLTVIAFWTGVSTQLSRDSVKSYDWIALFVFVAIFVLIQLAFWLITRQVMS